MALDKEKMDIWRRRYDVALETVNEHAKGLIFDLAASDKLNERQIRDANQLFELRDRVAAERDRFYSRGGDG